MSTTQVLLIVLALLLALAIAGFQYYYKSKGSPRQKALFAGLRFLTFFGLFLLLINPKIRNVVYYTEKPDLLLAVDNSVSISNFGEAQNVKDFVARVSEDPDLTERFEIETFAFGKNVTRQSDFEFKESQTNLSGTLKELNELYENSVAPTILITDGNQTLGEDYTFTAQRFDNTLFPVVVGDTTTYRDLAITRINVNKYAFLDNRFPVEIMLQYSGGSDVNTQLEIRSGNFIVYTKKVSFDGQNNSVVLQLDLPASSVGTRVYSAKLLPLSEEKNLINNQKEFAVEVIDERTRVLILHDLLHPDLGALKKSIESNRQREAVIQHIEETFDPAAFQLVILYQPTTVFQPLLEVLQEKQQNYWIVAGPKTDWRMLNGHQELFRQEITGQTEEFFPVYNENFSAFQFEDLKFEDFPPLKGNFGDLVIQSESESLLFRKLQGIVTTVPLLSISEEKEWKRAFLFGSGIWRWRSHVFQETNSFRSFDEFIGKLVQFLSSQKKRERLDLTYEPIYRGGESLVIKADYFDKNYVFDPDASLTLSLKNETTEKLQQVPLILKGKSYNVDLSNIEPGEYSFTVNVQGKNVSRSGKFKLISFDVEKQFFSANYKDLDIIASKRGERVYFPDDFEELKSKLLKTKKYLPMQKTRENNVPLIDWYYLLGIIILSLSLEWFLRKYYGYI
ncbi:vWA domain-containing protein [Salinimicrobium gaetbulicola]|uniref:VWA domain-containing protein n=1 Tax=Salinimicrobium gaetbulicola TaxID=999702 RepID=A0ABW3IBR3_9FLAO